MKSISFLLPLKNKWGDLQAEVSDNLKTYLASGKDFVVKFEYVIKGKSYNQIKGIHKLCELLAPRFSESYGTKFTMESAKLHVKLQFGYTRPCSYDEALCLAIEYREKRKAIGEKITIKAFNELVDNLQKTEVKSKSFADATLEEMTDLIKKIEELANRMEWPEVKLESFYMKDLVEFYNNKKE